MIMPFAAVFGTLEPPWVGVSTLGGTSRFSCIAPSERSSVGADLRPPRNFSSYLAYKRAKDKPYNTHWLITTCHGNIFDLFPRWCGLTLLKKNQCGPAKCRIHEIIRTAFSRCLLGRASGPDNGLDGSGTAAARCFWPGPHNVIVAFWVSARGQQSQPGS